MTITKINIAIFLASAIIIFVIMMRSYLKNKKMLGEKITDAPKGIKYTDLLIQTILVIALLATLLFSTRTESSAFTMNLLFLISGIILGHYIFQLFMAGKDKGFYQKGFMHNIGAGLYENYVDFKIVEKKNGVIEVRVFPEGRFSPVAIAYIKKEDKGKVKKLLKKGFNYSKTYKNK